jgi:hypothetical protein
MENRDSYDGGKRIDSKAGDREHDVSSVRDQEPYDHPPR